MTAQLDAALAYAARGWPVFPCKPGQKVPATAHGVLDATTDPEAIRTWWTSQPDANIGIATGTPGPDVLDIDVKNGNGYEAFAELLNAGIVEHPACVTTPSGGLHAYHAGTGQRNGTIRKRSIDFRGRGGYVLAPPSIVDGKPYQAATDFAATQLVTHADWQAIRAFLDPPPDPPQFTQPARDPAAPALDSLRPGDDYAARTSWPQLLIPYGWRQVRQLGGGRACWCRPGKAGSFTSATTRDDGGLYVFTTSTEFEPEIPYSKFGAYALLEHGGDHKAAAAQLRRDGFGTPEPAITFTQPPQTPGSSGENWWSELAARYTPIDWQQLFDDIPDEEDWIIEPLLAAGRSIALYSPPKAGKSLLVLEIAAALVTGRPVLGQPAGKIRKVLYVDLENSRRDIRDRLTDLGYKPADLGGLIYLSFPTLPTLDSAQGGREIMALALAHQADVVIIDTISRVISGKENDADTFAALYRYALAPLKGIGVAVVRLDHAGKDIGKGQRGSSAKNADVDAVWTLTVAGPIITLQCEMSRTQIDTQMLRLKRLAEPLRHELTTQAAGMVDKVQALMAKLDELGVPRDAGRPTCLKRLNEAGVPLDTNDLAKAVATRKLQPKLSDDLQTATLQERASSTLSEDHQTAQTETSKNPDQRLSEAPQTGSAKQAMGDTRQGCLSESPSRSEDFAETAAGADDDPPLCERCGEHHHRYGDLGRPCFPAKAGAP